MKKTETIQVGSDWRSCPYCHCSYITDDLHHIACPVSVHNSLLCRFCGVPRGSHHISGCPAPTGLFPVLHRELHCDLTCKDCHAPFKLGDCYVVGRSGLICVGCGWEEIGA